MAGGIGRIARTLLQGALRRQKYRAYSAAGLGGWKMDLFRAVRDMVQDSRRRRSDMPPRPRRKG